MMKPMLVVVVAMLSAGPVAAQTTSPPSRDTALGAVTGNRMAEGYGVSTSHYTPTMERQKAAQAIALRREAFALQAADGGTLSERNARYVQRKAQRILSY